ncbi:MAG TPA: site-2 protease family protein [Isosphaeraceae bacterium]|nr:site-2 protease family protein [Isosphaeraceae bacterium]
MSWKLGRVAGIDVYLHPTFLLFLAYFGAMQDGLALVLIISAAFGCVLLHELGHALMARRFGIETEDITLYPIGGVARLRRMPKAPGAELLIALAGPAVNGLIVLGLSSLLWLGAFGGPWSASPAAAFVSELMRINLALAVFNLIPAFPMDGGRVLRALLSGWLGRARATMVAAGLGRGLALLFGLFSLSTWISGMNDWGLVHVALAGFIYIAAGSELARVLAERRPRGRFFPRGGDGGGIWTAPPGFQWISRGNGVWQLAPIAVAPREPGDPSPWVGA